MKAIKSLFIGGVLFFSFQQNILAQKFAYVDSQFIIEQLPEYKAVQNEMDGLSKQWQKELDDAYAKIEKMYADYRAKEVLLTKDDKEKLQNDILAEERKAKELQKKYFGYDGALFKMREEKMRPVQEKVFNAVESVAKEKNVNFIFDKAGSVVILYSDSNFDYNKFVFAKLGIDASKIQAPEPSTKPTGGKK